jgi:hypothetical protein
MEHDQNWRNLDWNELNAAQKALLEEERRARQDALKGEEMEALSQLWDQDDG